MTKSSFITLGVFILFFGLLLFTSPAIDTYLYSPDLGYQVSLGWLVKQGRTPFADMLLFYGPFTAYASALAMSLNDCLFSEVVLCAAGYALALVLILRIASKHLPLWASVLCAAGAYLQLARFYKWYYWLFPLLALEFCISYLSAHSFRAARRYLICGGTAVALSGLFRLDLGLAGLLFFSTFIFLNRFKNQSRAIFKDMIFFVSSMLLPIFIWLVWLEYKGAPWHHFFTAVLSGGSGVVRQWSLPIPSFQGLWSLNGGGALFLALCITITIYVFCTSVGVFHGFLSTERGVLDRGMAATGIIGLAILPQALHRTDIPHLLQVSWPIWVAFPLIILWALKTTGRYSLLITIPALIFGLYVFCSVINFKPRDLGSPQWNLATTYQSLKNWENNESPVVSMLQSVIMNTDENDLIIDITLNPQFYYFTQRDMSGLINAYAAGVFSSNPWRRMNFEAVVQNPPALIISRIDLNSMDTSHAFRRFHPELFGFLLTHIERIIYDDDGWVLTRMKYVKG